MGCAAPDYDRRLSVCSEGVGEQVSFTRLVI